MALRAISIVNLESSIRASFDQQIASISSSMQSQSDSRRQSTTQEPDADSQVVDSPSPPEATERDTRSEEAQSTADEEAECQTVPNLCPDNADADDDALSDTLESEIANLSEPDRRSMGCWKFYKSHWLGHFVSGIVTGFLFVLLGVIFIVNGESFPFYAGLTLLILGLAPCCMAINRYRYARMYDRERRRAVNRLAALRRVHRRNRREQRGREQYPDLPPSYDNLGYDGIDENFQIVIDQQSTVDGTSTRSHSFALPTYDQCVKKERSSQDKDPSGNSESGVGSSNGNNNNGMESSHVSSPRTRGESQIFSIEIPGYYAGSTRDIVEEEARIDIAPSIDATDISGIRRVDSVVTVQDVEEADLRATPEEPGADVGASSADTTVPDATEIGGNVEDITSADNSIQTVDNDCLETVDTLKM